MSNAFGNEFDDDSEPKDDNSDDSNRESGYGGESLRVIPSQKSSRGISTVNATDNDALIHTLCFWLPIKFYELWIILSMVGFFAIWFVMMILVGVYIFYGLSMCQMAFTGTNYGLVLDRWLKSIDLFYLRDPVSLEVFNIKSYIVDEPMLMTRNIFFKKGLAIVIFGIIQMIVHFHGFYSFYFRQAMNLIIYSLILLLIAFIIFYHRTHFASLSTEVETKIFMATFVTVLYQKECNVCTPKYQLNTSSWSKLTLTDYLLKFQTCTLSCCGYKPLNQRKTFSGLFKPIPIVCCKKFHHLMFAVNTTYYIPEQLLCTENASSLAKPPLMDYPFSQTTTCDDDERIPSCGEILENSYTYKQAFRFTNFVTVFLLILGLYYFFCNIITALFVIERFYTRRRILKDIHSKLARYQV